MWTIPVPSPRAGQAPIDMPIVYCMLMAASGIPTGPPAANDGQAGRLARPHSSASRGSAQPTVPFTSQTASAPRHRNRRRSIDHGE